VAYLIWWSASVSAFAVVVSYGFFDKLPNSFCA